MMLDAMLEQTLCSCLWADIEEDEETPVLPTVAPKETIDASLTSDARLSTTLALPQTTTKTLLAIAIEDEARCKPPSPTSVVEQLEQWVNEPESAAREGEVPALDDDEEDDEEEERVVEPYEAPPMPQEEEEEEAEEWFVEPYEAPPTPEEEEAEFAFLVNAVARAALEPPPPMGSPTVRVAPHTELDSRLGESEGNAPAPREESQVAALARAVARAALGPPTPPPMGSPTMRVAREETAPVTFIDARLGKTQQLLGSGTFGTVSLESFDRKMLVAVKRHRGECEEAMTLLMLKHPHIVRLVDFAPGILVMEFGGRSLHDVLLTGEELPVSVLEDLASALSYMHSNRIAHCDLKPGNILVDSQKHVRICDLGEAQFGRLNKEARGGPGFWAPEVIRCRRNGTPYDPRPADCWSLGLVFVCIVTFNPDPWAPFQMDDDDDDDDRLDTYIGDGQIRPLLPTDSPFYDIQPIVVKRGRKGASFDRGSRS
ncbi:hypothetical protein CTAYLR_009755 [Chrysophaeum taylorii]|uniref:non-specific serine/threonine protein kinase n=1 Tax=Chrysophaeum taylorii TaxID=2483200 RepID=A0AAD7UB52_9STRA|nr:hypothetical protein CTAYLR_009755 [Chrysophaeum taylorii]